MKPAIWSLLALQARTKTMMSCPLQPLTRVVGPVRCLRVPTLRLPSLQLQWMTSSWRSFQRLLRTWPSTGHHRSSQQRTEWTWFLQQGRQAGTSETCFIFPQGPWGKLARGTHLSSVNGADRLEYTKLPPSMNSMLVEVHATPLPLKPCCAIVYIAEKAYMATGQAVFCHYTMTVLQVFKVKRLQPLRSRYT